MIIKSKVQKTNNQKGVIQLAFRLFLMTMDSYKREIEKLHSEHPN